jgi:hypothetical protein
MATPSNSNWWERNWKWFVPVGCLSVILIFVGGIALMVTFVFGLMKTSDAYVQALSRAKENPAVVEALGRPIEDGYFSSGSINETGPSGRAELAIPISGPKGSGTIYLEANESANQWSFSKLEVEIDKTGERIDLLTESDERARLPEESESQKDEHFD